MEPFSLGLMKEWNSLEIIEISTYKSILKNEENGLVAPLLDHSLMKIIKCRCYKSLSGPISKIQTTRSVLWYGMIGGGLP